jgi:hypothetical protein
MNKYIYVGILIVILLIVYYLYLSPTPSNVPCPLSNLCYDCNKYWKYGPSSLKSDNRENEVLNTMDAMKACGEMSECVGVMTLDGDDTKAQVLTQYPMNYGSRTSSVYYEKRI